MSTIDVGPFQRIVGFRWPEHSGSGGGGGGSDILMSCYVHWTMVEDPDVYGWRPVFSDIISGQPDGASNVVTVINGTSPDYIAAPADVVGPPEYDADAEQFYRVITKVTGLQPSWSPEDQFIYYFTPSPRNTFSGSNCIAPMWTITFRRYYYLLGIEREQILSQVESAISFNFGSVVLRGTDGITYNATSFQPGIEFPALMLTIA